MFKLRLIKKPILFKLKCDFSFPPIVLANLQEKEVTPTKEKQEVVADKNKHIRDINDVYTPATETEEEHKPYYASIIFLADNFEDSKLNELYVEEDI